MVSEYQAIVDVCQTQIVYQSDAQRVQNDLHFHREGGWAEGDLSLLNTTIGDWWDTHAKVLLPEELSIVEITSTDLTSLAGSRVSLEYDSPIAGTHASPIMPLNVTLAIKLATANRGRGRNGRIFWPAFSEDQIAGDRVLTATASAIVTALNNLITEVQAADPQVTCVVAHRIVAGAKIYPGGYTPVVGFTVTDNYVDSQKDRLPFHKKHKKKKV